MNSGGSGCRSPTSLQARSTAMRTASATSWCWRSTRSIGLTASRSSRGISRSWWPVGRDLRRPCRRISAWTSGRRVSGRRGLRPSARWSVSWRRPHDCGSCRLAPGRATGYPLLFERVLPPHSPAQLGASPSQPRRPGCTPRAASGRPCGVTRSMQRVETPLQPLRLACRPFRSARFPLGASRSHVSRLGDGMSFFDGLDEYIRQARPRYEEWLGRLVEIPTVSMDPARRNDMWRGAEVAVGCLTSLGAQATIVETGGYPLVVGGWMQDLTWPTVAVYNHLDVQPAVEPEWTREPFKFTVEGEHYHGRGATDDKGPALTALLAARYAVEQGVPVNIQLVWELEEEMGSPHFAEGLAKAVDCRKPDSVVVSDTIWLAGGRPAVPYGLRGNLAARLILETARREAHSGLTGGAARNPLTELAAVVAACVDAKTGRVAIPGFYKAVRPLGRTDRAQFLKSGFQVKAFATAHQLTKLRVRDRLEVMRRLCCSWA